MSCARGQRLRRPGLVVPVALPGSRCPAGSVRACSPMRRASSASSRASRRSTESRPKPPLRKWTWASLKPGTTSRPAQLDHPRARARRALRRRRRRPRPARGRRAPRSRWRRAGPSRPRRGRPRRTRSAAGRRRRASDERRRPGTAIASAPHSYHLQDHHRHVVVLGGVARRSARISARMRSFSSGLVALRARSRCSSTSRSRRSPNSSAPAVHGLREAVGEEQEDVAAAQRRPPPPPGSRSKRRPRSMPRPRPGGVSTRVRPVAASRWMSGLWPARA